MLRPQATQTLLQTLLLTCHRSCLAVLIKWTPTLMKASAGTLSRRKQNAQRARNQLIVARMIDIALVQEITKTRTESSVIGIDMIMVMRNVTEIDQGIVTLIIITM